MKIIKLIVIIVLVGIPFFTFGTSGPQYTCKAMFPEANVYIINYYKLKIYKIHKKKQKLHKKTVKKAKRKYKGVYRY